MRITDKINFRQPKYMLPAIVYIPLIATGYFVFDMFNTEVAASVASMRTWRSRMVA